MTNWHVPAEQDAEVQVVLFTVHVGTPPLTTQLKFAGHWFAVPGHTPVLVYLHTGGEPAWQVKPAGHEATRQLVVSAVQVAGAPALHL